MKVTRKVAAGLRKMAEQGTSLVSDQEALNFIEAVPTWKKNAAYAVDDRVTIVENGSLALYKCVQAHTSKNKDNPSGSNLWVRIDAGQKGTIDEPIAAVANMTYQKGLYYSENGVTYLCTKKSKEPLQYVPSQLIGVYFEKV